MSTKGIARKAVAAGLGLAMAIGAVAPVAAFADDSTGNTNLYVLSDTSNLTTPEGTEDENIKVDVASGHQLRCRHGGQPHGTLGQQGQD